MLYVLGLLKEELKESKSSFYSIITNQTISKLQ